MIQPHSSTSSGTQHALMSAAVPDLLDRWHHGDTDAARDVLAMVYGEMRMCAHHLLGNERVDHTLQPTALVHEAFVRLMKGRAPDIGTRQELIRIAAHVMRQVLVNHANRRRTLRRGGDAQRVALDPALSLFEDRCHDLIGLDEALERLSGVDPRQAAIVELRFFGGMELREIATLLDVSLRTVEREWSMARAWLRKEIAP